LKKAWATRRANAAFKASHPNTSIAEHKAAMRDVDQWNVEVGPLGFSVTETPGHGEIVGGAEHQFAEEIAKLARKKGGKDAIQNLITNRIAIARAEGQSLAERGRSELSQKAHEVHCDKVVRSALATWELASKLNGGLPAALVVSGYTIARMIDVLNRHGYRGFDGQ
jgi:hypothetical protein